MALFPQDRRGQLLVVLTLVAAAATYFTGCGNLLGVAGVTTLTVRRDSMQRELDSLNIQVANARRDVASGAIQQLEARLAEYRATLDLMRTLVPSGIEIPNLLDDVSSRAKVRGANLVNFVPAPLESGQPFDTQRARYTVTGQYDQIGEFLSDVASLQRIVVPYDLRLQRITSPTADSALRASGQILQASFQIRTYVKTTVIDTSATPNAPRAPARGGDE